MREETARATRASGVWTSGGHHAGETNRLTGPWSQTPRSIDEIIWAQLQPMRARSREECFNNNHARKFLQMVQNNVCGATGFVLQAQSIQPGGERDKAANKAIELAWKEWGKFSTCDYLGKLSWRELQILIARNLAMDGEVLIQKLRGAKVNRFGFALRILDPELLDVMDIRELSDGGYVRFGIEFDREGRVRAYHLSNPARTGAVYLQHSRGESVRVPADEIIHLHLVEHAGQKRGIPWMATALFKMHTLDEYEEYALQNAKAGAAKTGFYQQNPELTDEDYLGDREDQETGEVEEDIEPLSARKLPPGWTFQSFEPDYPTGEYWPFQRAGIRSIAAGLGVSYHSLAQDLEGVNYSSMRGGVQEERDGWMVLQDWVVEHLCEPVYREWLSMALLMDAIPGVQLERESEYQRVVWQAKRWDWVDPLKDASALELEYSAGVESLTGWARRKGRDLEQVFEERRAEEALAKEYGITLGAPAEPDRRPSYSDDPDEAKGDDEKDPERALDALLIRRVLERRRPAASVDGHNGRNRL
jgi:lambda family phage portal protein